MKVERVVVEKGELPNVYTFKSARHWGQFGAAVEVDPNRAADYARVMGTTLYLNEWKAAERFARSRAADDCASPHAFLENHEVDFGLMEGMEALCREYVADSTAKLKALMEKAE